jgi:hypothetical protein
MRSGPNSRAKITSLATSRRNSVHTIPRTRHGQVNPKLKPPAPHKSAKSIFPFAYRGLSGTSRLLGRRVSRPVLLPLPSPLPLRLWVPALAADSPVSHPNLPHPRHPRPPAMPQPSATTPSTSPPSSAKISPRKNPPPTSTPSSGISRTPSSKAASPRAAVLAYSQQPPAPHPPRTRHRKIVAGPSHRNRPAPPPPQSHPIAIAIRYTSPSLTERWKACRKNCS